MTSLDIRAWLLEERPESLSELWRRADRARRDQVGDVVHLRGLIEISNRCRRDCTYCGLRAANRNIARYRMGQRDILDCARLAARLGLGTVVIQAAEDPGLTAEWVARLIGRIRSETGLTVTLSLGERSVAALELWRRAGADRYLLRFETSNRLLYQRCHPAQPGRSSTRLGLLRILRALGYETGSGTLVGLPGQRLDDLIRDIELFARLDLDMIGLGPFLPHPDTPLGHDTRRLHAPPGQQVRASDEMTCKALALARLVCPQANIPATSALATLNRARGIEMALTSGANVIMPNLTPARFQPAYAPYPGKAEPGVDAETLIEGLRARILDLGRSLGSGPGQAPAHARKVQISRGQESPG